MEEKRNLEFYGSKGMIFVPIMLAIAGLIYICLLYTSDAADEL